ncbi:class I SAM-dependent methyltransferase [Mycobacterium sp. OTB74]|uniref:class I SAM-dependent methyltransferase n=1 Tax=Mycobacterium sp. OTB74 TaxID=1853452 RepID=UPI00247617B4|nr:class I SAM-dependent methyltransferase [Mycobacterium sp. OTB74]MDH6242476.1 putative RNA methylase [Mycobacterium sp. OTB74]
MSGLTPDLLDTLGADLRAAGYTTDGVAELLGPGANAALGRGVWWPALHATGEDRLSTLIRLFLLGTSETMQQVQAALPSVPLDALGAAGVLDVADTVRAALDIRPHSDGEHDFFVVSDQDAALRGGPVEHDHVLGIGGASMSLARAVIRTPVRRALDLGTGCGIQALHLNSHCDQIVATDTNQRALQLAVATARLNGMSWDMRAGSLFEPVVGERFDLIVSNPPFVVGSGSLDYIYRDSGVAGDGLCRSIIENIGEYLNPGGTAQIMANWIVREGDWRERVAGWLAGTGLHAWVVQRELADPVSYVSLWLADAGETSDQTAARGAAWLDWFAQQDITGIGMGLICLQVPREGEAPEQIFEEITDEPLTGLEVAAFFARRAYLRDTTDEALLAARLSTAPVFLEEQWLPGADGWQQIGAAVRRPGGPAAVIGVDEVMRALLAGCRGEVPLGTLIQLLAAHHGVNADALAQAALSEVRDAIGRGILYQAT